MFSLHYFFFVATLYLCVILLRFSSLDTAVLAEETITSPPVEKVSSGKSTKLKNRSAEKSEDMLSDVESEIELSLPQWGFWDVIKLFSDLYPLALHESPDTLEEINKIPVRPLQEHKNAMIKSAEKSFGLLTEKLDIFLKRILAATSWPLSREDQTFLDKHLKKLQKTGTDETRVRTIKRLTLELLESVGHGEKDQSGRSLVPAEEKVFFLKTLVDMVHTLVSCQSSQLFQQGSKSAGRALGDVTKSVSPPFSPGKFLLFNLFPVKFLEEAPLFFNDSRLKEIKTRSTRPKIMSSTQTTKQISIYIGELISSLEKLTKDFENQAKFESSLVLVNAILAIQLESFKQKKKIAYDILKLTEDYFFCLMSSEDRTLEPMKQALPEKGYRQMLKELQRTRSKLYRDVSAYYLHSQRLVTALEKQFGKLVTMHEELKKSLNSTSTLLSNRTQ